MTTRPDGMTAAAPPHPPMSKTRFPDNFFERIQLSGTPREIGRQHGRLQKDRIRQLIETLKGATVSEDKRRYAERMEAYLRANFPDIIEEWRGLAEGAEIRFEQAFVLSAAPSLAELPAPHLCSAIAWNQPNSGPFLFKTDDGPGRPPGDSDADVIRRRLWSKVVLDLKTPGSHRALGVGDAGRLFLEVGFNDQGLGMGHSSGRPVLGDQDGYGIPQHMFPGLVLRYCANCAEVLEFARRHPIAGKGVNIATADRQRNLLAVEKCGGRTGFRESREWAFTTNHYQDPSLFEETRRQVPAFLTSKYLADSSMREQFLKARLPRVCAVQGRDPKKALQELLADGPGRICQCFQQDEGMWTNYAAFIHPPKRTMEIYLGPHSRKAYAVFSL